MKALLSFVLLLVMGTLWGLQFAMIKLAAMSGYNEMNILMLTLMLISIFYGFVIVVRRNFFTLNRETLIFLVVISILGYVLPLVATVYAAPHVPAGVISLVVCMSPVLTVFLALVLGSEAVSRRRVLGVLLGTVAVALVLWPELQMPHLGLMWWILLLLSVPFCYAIENIYVAVKWPAGLSTVQMVAAEAFVASALMLPLFVWLGEPGAVKLQWTDAEIGIVLYVAAGVAEALLYFYIIRVSGGVLVSFGSFIALFAGIGWGILIFDESHASSVWLAAVILLTALGCVTVPSASQHQSPR